MVTKEAAVPRERPRRVDLSEAYKPLGISALNAVASLKKAPTPKRAPFISEHAIDQDA